MGDPWTQSAFLHFESLRGSVRFQTRNDTQDDLTGQAMLARNLS